MLGREILKALKHQYTPGTVSKFNLIVDGCLFSKFKFSCISMVSSKYKENSLQRMKKNLVTMIKITFINKGSFKYNIWRKSDRLNFQENHLVTR